MTARAITASVIVDGQAHTGTATVEIGPPNPSGMSLLLNEEFTGSAVDSTRWGVHDSPYGNELHWHRPQNVEVSGGTLKIWIKREAYSGKPFTSGMLGSRDIFGAHTLPVYYPRFGRYEFRARLPHAQGLWPGFWLRHRNGASAGEVDIMEYFHSGSPGYCTGTLWHNTDGAGSVMKRAQKAMPFFEAPVKGDARGWHTWGVSIVPEAGGVRFTYDQDGVVYIDYLDAVTGPQHWSNTAPKEATFDVAFQCYVGGAWVGHPDDDPLGRLHGLTPGRCAIGQTTVGYPDSCAVVSPQGHPILREALPENVEIDYVRVWRWDAN